MLSIIAYWNKDPFWQLKIAQKQYEFWLFEIW
jgi:hypothetical protein